MKEKDLESKAKTNNPEERITCSLPICSVNQDGSYGKVVYRLPYTIKPLPNSN